MGKITKALMNLIGIAIALVIGVIFLAAMVYVAIWLVIAIKMLFP